MYIGNEFVPMPLIISLGLMILSGILMKVTDAKMNHRPEIQPWKRTAAQIAALTPLAWPLRHKAEHPEGGAAVSGGMGDQLRVAFADRSYWCLHAGFFTCGFHVAFLITHLPGEVQLCGLPASVAATSIAIIGLANIHFWRHAVPFVSPGSYVYGRQRWWHRPCNNAGDVCHRVERTRATARAAPR